MFDAFKDSFSKCGNEPIDSRTLEPSLNNLKKHVKRFVWKNAVQFVFGFDPKHLSLTHSHWTLTTWNKDEVPEIVEAQARANDNPKLAIGDHSHLMEIMDKLFLEMQQTSRKTTPTLKQMQIIRGPNTPRLLAYPKIKSIQKDIDNILTNDGMAEMGKNRTGESVLTNAYHAIGTGVSAEALTDHVTYSGALQTEQARKVIGTRTVVNQTERYGTAFVDTDITPPKDITEAGVLTAALGAILMLRVTADPQNLDTGNIITAQTNVSHQNGTEV